jgi:predicted proteasome-type protease
MRSIFAVLAVFVGVACASNPSRPADVRHAQEVLTSVRVAGVLAKGIEASADAKLITVPEAHQALDIVKAAVKTLKASNGGAFATMEEALTQIGKLPFASKIQRYLEAARLGLVVVNTAGTIPVDAITQVVFTMLPSIMAFIKKRREESGEDPTLEEVQAHVAAEADAVVLDIEGWEAKNPV